MKIYSVISMTVEPGNDLCATVEGTYKNYNDAKRKFDEIIKNWHEYLDTDEFDENRSEEGFYSLTNFTEDEYSELKIEESYLE